MSDEVGGGGDCIICGTTKPVAHVIVFDGADETKIVGGICSSHTLKEVIFWHRHRSDDNAETVTQLSVRVTQHTEDAEGQ